MSLSIYRIILLKGVLRKFSRVSECTICYETRRLYSLHKSSYIHGLCRTCLGSYNRTECHICRTPVPESILTRWNIQQTIEEEPDTDEEEDEDSYFDWRREINLGIIEPLNRGIVNDEILIDQMLELIDYINSNIHYSEISDYSISSNYNSILSNVPTLLRNHRMYSFTEAYFSLVWSKIKRTPYFIAINDVEYFTMQDVTYEVANCEYYITCLEDLCGNNEYFCEKYYIRYAQRLKFAASKLRDKISDSYKFASKINVTLGDIPRDELISREFFT